jgi:hypothetical protein
MASDVKIEGVSALDAGTTSDPARRSAASRILSGVIFISLLALLPLSAAPYASVEPWWTGLFDALVFLLAALWAVEGAFGGRWFVRAHMLMLPAFALTAFALLQSTSLPSFGVISFDPYETRLFALRLLAVSTYAALLIRYAVTERRLRALVAVLLAVGAASALFGVFRQVAQREQMGFVLALLPKGVGYAQFVGRNSFAFLMEMALGLAVGMVAGRGVSRQKMLVFVAAALPLWVALVLSNSRGGIFAMLCQVLFIAATFGVTKTYGAAEQGRVKEDRGPGDNGREETAASRLGRSPAVCLVLGALLVATVVVGTVWMGGDPLAERMETIRDEVGASRTDPEQVGRAGIWKSTWRLFAEHPVAGVGLGGYWIAVRGVHEGSGVSAPRQAHNDYLELLSSAGVVGALPLIIFVLLFIRRVRQRLRAGTPFARAAALGALVGVVGVAAHSLVDFGLHVTANALFFAALVAVAAVEVRQPGEQKN